MIKKSEPLTKVEIEDARVILAKGRNRYEDALLEIEQVWNKLRPNEYVKRKKLVKAVLKMAQIDQKLKGWEKKLDFPDSL